MSSNMRVFAIGCEMINIHGMFEDRSIIGRVTITDRFERIILDEYVKPIGKVYSYGSCCSMTKKMRLMKGKELPEVAVKVANLIDGCILVGYNLSSDLSHLGLTHPPANCKDLAEYEPFVTENNGNTVKLEVLAQYYVSRTLKKENGAQDSADKANTCMELYRMFETNW